MSAIPARIVIQETVLLDRGDRLESSFAGASTLRKSAASLMLVLTALSGCASGPGASQHTTSALSSVSSTDGESIAGKVQASDDASIDRRFAQWVAKFRETARAAGIDDATLHAALDGVQLRPRIIELDRNQPEFTRTIWDYLDTIITPQRVARGRQMLVQFSTEADAARTHYGVPGNILMAIWGLESNFGSNYGDMPVIDALATLGFDGRRENWARDELMAALKILQRGDIDRDRMIGSWAGAMGQTQFMPSIYLAYAVDADGDGRRDIWNSMADVLASTANFLARVGWRAEEPWGAEVQLPAGFDLARADPAAVRQSSAQWSEAGVRSIDGSSLPGLTEASILLPAGARGPAFIIGHNFRTIFQYNNSISYALTVCLLAQRIGGGLAVQAPWPRELRALTRGEMQALQTGLNRRGFDSGQPDGLMGPATRKALRQFQRSQGLQADGYPTSEVLQLLRQEQ